MALFKKYIKRQALDVIKEVHLTNEKLKKAEQEDQKAYQLNMENVTQAQSIVKVLELFNKNGLTFMLTEEETKHFKDILKKK